MKRDGGDFGLGSGGVGAERLLAEAARILADCFSAPPGGVVTSAVLFDSDDPFSFEGFEALREYEIRNKLLLDETNGGKILL
jgi:hypothetical protein